MSLFVKHEPKECSACAVYKEQIEFMKKLVESIQRERDAERTEYKRAIDVILVREKLPIVGQVPTTAVPSNMKMEELMGYFEEKAPEGK